MAKVKAPTMSSTFLPEASDQFELDETTPVAPSVPAGIQRRFKGQQSVNHDLYKLDNAPMQKNESFTDIPFLVPVDHSHFFHTVDSNGEAQSSTNLVGGHFHKIEVISNGPDAAPTLLVSPPFKYVNKRVNGRYVKQVIPFPHDTHTHTVTYLHSEVIQLRQPNAEFARLSSAIEAKQPKPVEGVVGG